jgi:putative phage-type endonuclease
MTKAPEAREDWLAERRKRLGATDVSAIIGINPYRTAYEVWLDKLDMLEPWSGNDATDLGNILEPAILDEAERRWGPIERQMVVHDNNSPIAATLDGWLVEREQVVEVKTAGLTNAFAELRYWGEEYSDDIPQWYLIQMQVQLLCTESEVGRMLALISGRGLVTYEVSRDDEVATVIRQKCTDWWEKHVVKKIEPSKDNLPSIEVLKRIKREPNSVTTFYEPVLELVDDWEVAKEEAKQSVDRLDGIKARLIAELGQHEAGTLPDGRTLTFFESTRKGYEVKPCKFRTLRVAKNAG